MYINSFGALPLPNGRNRFFIVFYGACDGDEATLDDCTQRRGTCVRSASVRGSIAVVCGGQSEVNWISQMQLDVATGYTQPFFPSVQTPSLPTVYDEAVRLRGGSNNCEGRLEMYSAIRRQWETTCDRNFGSEEAEVVCRQLRCGTQGVARTAVQE